MSYAQFPQTEEPEFLDIVYDWMNRAPWLAISAAAHIIVFLILAVVPWSLLHTEETKEIIARMKTPQEPAHERTPEEPEKPIEPPEVPMEPVEPLDPVDPNPPTPLSPVPSPPSAQSFPNPIDTPFQEMGALAELGIGGGAGPKGSRFNGSV